MHIAWNNKGKITMLFSVVDLRPLPRPQLASIGEHACNCHTESRKAKREGGEDPLSLSQLTVEGEGC
jgi:hypothetical protein